MADSSNIHDLFKVVKDHPDFAGGAIFTREDVAGVLFEPDGGWEDDDPGDPAEGSSVPHDLVAKVTPADLISAQEAIEAFIFEGSYTWRDAISDRVKFDVWISEKAAERRGGD